MGDNVTGVLHHVPEEEGFEDGYEAVTMTGVPYNIAVMGSDPDAAEGALRHLLDGLRAFGFSGREVVFRAWTGEGGVYETELALV